MWGREITLADGSTVIADEEYIVESIVEPSVKLVEGFGSVMTPYAFEDDEMEALVRFLQATSE